MVQRRIFVSATTDQKLDKRRQALKAAILFKLEQRGFVPQMFFETGLPANLPWTFDNVD